MSKTQCSFPLDKIHCDLWGLTLIPSLQQFRYYVVFVDDFSRYCWFYPLKTKHDFFEIFTSFQRMVKNPFERKIKTFQFDGGGESTSPAAHGHYFQCGIYHQITCLKTPRHNGIAKGKHRHIVELGLVTLF